jgi:murein DD-endopeptidase MepM/ murein hydrolase activator NlpD
MTTSRKTSTRALAALMGSFLALAATGLVLDSAAQASSAGTGCSGSYAWPVKPFDRQHPIRGNFGDPRTVFDGRRSQGTIDSGDGMFQFHHGVDIAAPDGSPVYAVADGTITRTHGDRVTVECANGRAIQYWHITVAAVRVGQHAVAGKTVLGYILPKREHVHLTQLENGRPVNPLLDGRLEPYRDGTDPSVLAVSFRRSDLGSAIRPDRVSGRVYAYVEAWDTPALPVPGRWHGFPVTPAMVSWRIETARGRTVVSNRVAWDVRQTLPATNAFWLSYARGSHQNWPVFSDGKARGMTGRYVFRVSMRALDADLRAGTYVLVVKVADTAGNRDTLRQRFHLGGGLSPS